MSVGGADLNRVDLKGNPSSISRVTLPDGWTPLSVSRNSTLTNGGPDDGGVEQSALLLIRAAGAKSQSRSKNISAL